MLKYRRTSSSLSDIKCPYLQCSKEVLLVHESIVENSCLNLLNKNKMFHLNMIFLIRIYFLGIPGSKTSLTTKFFSVVTHSTEINRWKLNYLFFIIVFN